MYTFPIIIINIKRSTLSMIESGKNKSTMIVIRQLSDFYKIPIDTIKDDDSKIVHFEYKTNSVFINSPVFFESYFNKYSLYGNTFLKGSPEIYTSIKKLYIDNNYWECIHLYLSYCRYGNNDVKLMPEIRLIIGMCYYNLGVDYWGIAYQYLKDNKLVDESRCTTYPSLQITRS